MIFRRTLSPQTPSAYRTLLLAFVASTAWLISGCDSGASPSASAKKTYAGDGPIRVTCTVGMLADIVEQIGGDRLEVTRLMGPGTDPHGYKTSPGDVKKLGSSDLILYCGHHLEGKMGDVLARLERRILTVAVCEQIPDERLLADEENPNAFDPHLWFDVALWRDVARVVTDRLSEFDSEHAASYRMRLDALATKLEQLDTETRTQLASIPEPQRVLVTAHDAFRYLGRAYDLEVVGIQGLSTESEASVQRINELVDFIVTRKIKAVFVESTVPEKNMRSLIEGCGARGHTVSIGGSLYSDAMGADGTPAGTYEGMVRHNVSTLVDALR